MSSTDERRSHQNPFLHIRQKSNDDWYLYWVCEDEDFNKSMSEYINHYEKRIEVIDGELVDKTTKEDMEQAEKVRLDILSNYGLDESEFDIIQTGLHLQMPLDFRLVWVGYEDDGGTRIIIPSDIKYDEYINAWPIIKEMSYISRTYDKRSGGKKISRKTRNRAADDTQLVYAIFKARKAGLTFKEIYLQYQSGELPCYLDRPRNDYNSEDSLERYYRKYKPDR